VVGAETEIGTAAVLGAHVVVGRRCRIGSGVMVHPNVSIYDRTEIERGCVVHSGAVLGGDGFGYAPSPQGLVKVPQVGRLVIEAEVEIGANSAVDRGALEETRIGTGTKIDNLVQVGHNVILGPHCVLCGQAGVAGSLVVGKGVVFGGQAGAAGHLEIGDQVQVAGKSAVFQTVEPGEVVGGIPAGPIREWRRQSSALRRLPELLRRVARLERRLGNEKEGESGE
jgi:UDP-3-O-[3-hydroxymyristoyl] glucosamine N-acyltransferase